MIVLITVHDSSCLVGFLPFVRQFDSAPQTNGVHRIRSSVQRFTCTARTCKDCRKRLMLYLYTLPRFDLHACTERIRLQVRTKCLFLFITMQSATIIHTFASCGHCTTCHPCSCLHHCAGTRPTPRLICYHSAFCVVISLAVARPPLLWLLPLIA